MAERAAPAERDRPQPTPYPPPLLLTITRPDIHWANNITLFSICALWLTLRQLGGLPLLSVGPWLLPENKVKLMFLASHNKRQWHHWDLSVVMAR